LDLVEFYLVSEIVASEFWSNLIANFKWLTEGLKGKTCLTDISNICE